MIIFDEDALICDLAETYQLYDYRQLPPLRVAVFSCGLHDDSRIKMKMSGQSVDLKTLLLAGIADRLSTLIWFQTEDGQKGKNRPTPLINLLTNNKKEENKEDVIIFNSGEDFEKQRLRLIKTGGE